jgi:hypothetical protein
MNKGTHRVEAVNRSESRDAAPQIHATAIRVWAWIDVGRIHCRDHPEAYPDCATTSPHAATTGNVAQQVLIPDIIETSVTLSALSGDKTEGRFTDSKVCFMVDQV